MAPLYRPEVLLAAGDHVVNRSNDFLIGTVHATALGDHPGAGEAVHTTVVQHVGTLGNTLGPGSGITVLRRAGRTGAVTGHTRGVIDRLAGAGPAAGDGRGGATAVTHHATFAHRLDPLLDLGALGFGEIYCPGAEGQAQAVECRGHAARA